MNHNSRRPILNPLLLVWLLRGIVARVFVVTVNEENETGWELGTPWILFSLVFDHYFAV